MVESLRKSFNLLHTHTMSEEVVSSEPAAASRQESGHVLSKRGALILGLFALVWAWVGASGITSGGATPTLVLVVAVAAAAVAVLLAVRSTPTPANEGPRQLPDGWHRRVGQVNLAQAGAIVVAVAAPLAAGAPSLIPPLVCLIVGVHFFPLTRLFGQPQYRWTAIGLTAVAAAGFITVIAGASQETCRAVVGLSAAVVLWASSLHLTRRG